jgi:hypothetical protein
MVNFVETLFGVAIVAALAAAVLSLRGRRPLARRITAFGLVVAAVAVALEIWLQTR